MAVAQTDPLPAWFQESRLEMDDFPCNIRQTELFDFNLAKYNKQVQETRPVYFHRKRRGIFVWELRENETKYRISPKLIDESQVSQFFDERVSDAVSGFIFIRSPTNRSALGCSKEQLGLIFTHHQVMVPFLDLVFTFRMREEPETLTYFRQEDYLTEPCREFSVTKFARSGLRIQHCFNLVSIEHAPEQEEWPWPFRQAAMCHSFDIDTGRALYINLKANDVMMERIKSATTTHRQLKADHLTSREKKFVATLLIHLIMFEWCLENWPEYITFLEEKVQNYAKNVKFTPIEEMSAPKEIELSFSRKGTMNTQAGPSRQNTVDKSMPEPGFQAPKLVKQLSERFATIGKKSHQPIANAPDADEPAELKVDLAKVFSFTELQKLSQVETDIHTTLLVMNQDIEAINQVLDHYAEVLETQNVRAYLDIEAMKTDTAAFFRKGRQLVQDMETHAQRLKLLAGSLDSIKSQFYGVLQYRNMRTGEHFASSSYESAKLMEDIAVKTKQETVSMHAITILTLIFLPGTFIAILLLLFLYSIPRPFLTHASSLQTVFGSGVVDWDENGPGGQPRADALKLFFMICIPVTAATFCGWCIWYCTSKRRTNRKRKLRGLFPLSAPGTVEDEKNVAGNIV